MVLRACILFSFAQKKIFMRCGLFKRYKFFGAGGVLANPYGKDSGVGQGCCYALTYGGGG